MAERDEGIVYHASVGAGPPLVLLGGIHFDHTHLRPWLDPLCDIATVVYVDHRGTGQSPTPDNFDRLDHDTWVGDIAALINQLGCERMVLFGHSYGGFLAQEFALRHPSRLDGLILCDTASAMDYSDVIMANAKARASGDLLETVIHALTQPSTDDHALRQTWLDILPLYFHRFEPKYRDLFSEGVRYSAGAFNRGFFECLPGIDMTESLQQVDVPTLVLGGRHDWVAPVEQGAERLHKALSNSEMVVFEESGHFPFIEEPGRFVSTVMAWLQRLAR